MYPFLCDVFDEHEDGAALQEEHGLLAEAEDHGLNVDVLAIARHIQKVIDPDVSKVREFVAIGHQREHHHRMDEQENATLALIEEEAHIVNHHLPEEEDHEYLQRLKEEDVETFLDDLDDNNDLVISIVSAHHVKENIIDLEAEIPDHQRADDQLPPSQLLLHHVCWYAANFHQHFDALQRPSEPEE